MKFRSAFTMVELIFVIVIIGILASVAIPKLTGVTDGAKKTAEIATISAVSTAIETASGEWSINEGDFTWGIRRTQDDINNTTGYPKELGSSDEKPFDYVIKSSGKFKKIDSSLNSQISIFTGPASDKTNGVKFDTSATNSDIPNRPDKNDFWVYAFGVNECNITCTNCVSKSVYYGDLTLIDVTEEVITLPTITCSP